MHRAGGVEAISNGVPAFRRPKSVNAAKTLVAIGATEIVMFSGITVLGIISKGIAERTCDLVGFTGNCGTDPQRSVPWLLGLGRTRQVSDG